MTQGTFDGFEPGDYERRKERARKREADMSKSGRDIGPLPEIPPRGLIVKEACRLSLQKFLEFFLRAIFRLAWSPDHLEAIRILEDTILNGGQFCFAMPRGNGKSSLSLGAVIWAMVYGHRQFLVPVCATGPAAERFLESIKTIIETNTRLAKVFPEVCYPIHRLDGINNRTGGQILGGERTRIKWTGKRLILPTVAGSPASGVIVHAAGLLGSVRGLSQAAPEDADTLDAEAWWNDTSDIDEAFEPEPTEDGGMVRPDCTILDDPQTDESARHPAQTTKRIEIVNKAILNLAGPDKKIAAVMPCTVIQPDDMADQLLDRERNPEWRGRRTRLISAMPDEDTLKLWRKYREIRDDSLRAHEDIRLASEWYRANHKAVTRGVVASWPERYESEHVDAIQYAIERWCKSEEAFWAEYQNQPLLERQDGIECLIAKELLCRCDGSEEGELPEWATRVTAYIDIQQDILPFVIVAWGKDLRGRIMHYGGWPRQARSYYTLREVSPTLRQATGMETVEAAIEVGLEQLIEWILDLRWVGDGREIGCDWLGIDANWELSKQIVYTADRKRPRVHACHGKFVGAAMLPMDLWKKQPGDRKGNFWRLVWKDRVQTVEVDNNSWKTLTAKRLQVAPPDGITWYGSEPHRHRMLCDELAAEFGVRVVGRGRKVDEWKNRPGRDNHWWDCLVGAAVGASICGLELVGQAKAPEVKRVKASQAQRARRGGR